MTTEVPTVASAERPRADLAPVPRLRRAVVLGAGTMGAQVACLLAGRGVRVDLLDLDASTAAEGLRRATRLSPAPLFLADDVAAIRPAGFDALETALSGADWVLEAVVERLDVKRELLARVGPALPPAALLASNTSSLSVAAMAEALPPDVAQRFLGMHFFNPPRYARLVELVPGPVTSAAALLAARRIAEILGKAAVDALDAPGFIVNRLGTHASLVAITVADELGLGVDEVDDLAGPLVGRPKSAVFRTIDLVGLDVFAAVVRSLAASVPADDPARAVFRVSPVAEAMLERGMLGTKAGRGFYRKDGPDILALDPATLEYRPRKRVRSGTVEIARQAPDPAQRLAALLAGAPDDAAATFVRRTTAASLAYAAAVAPSIAGSVADVDRAMRWGLGWERGPFETWDLLGAERVASLLTDEGLEEPPLARAAREAGGFYADGGALQLDLAAFRGAAFRGDTAAKAATPGGAAAAAAALAPAAMAPAAMPPEHRTAPGATSVPATDAPAPRVPVPPRVRVISLAAVRRDRGALAGNVSASVVELDGALALDLHGKLNIIGLDTIAMVGRATALAEERGLPLVVATDAADFSAGANLALMLLEAEDEEWDELDRVVRRFQAATTGLRAAEVPVVVALRGRVLGGGCELALYADRVQAAAETYMGLVELGVGLIPAGGGSTEMARRAAARNPGGTWGDAFPAFAAAFENVAIARVSTGAPDARRLGFLRAEDAITADPDRVLADALSVARALAETGYRPPLERPVPVAGRRGIAAAESLTHNQLAAGFISAYDRELALALAHVMSGGNVAEGTEVAPGHLLDLERETFLRLLGQPKTRDRIRHTLRTGKPLRN